MGCWMSANGRLVIKPAVTDELIREYIIFSEDECPPEYEGEKFSNPWHFDSENMLVCGAGKFAEPSIWYNYLKEHFFEARGYELNGRPLFTGECDGDFWALEMDKEQHEYVDWLRRASSFFDDNSKYSKRKVLKLYEERMGKNKLKSLPHDAFLNPITTSNVMRTILFRIKDRAEEAYYEYKNNEKDAFADGRSLAYYEMLEMIQNVLVANEVDLCNLGLNFNLEERYI